VLADAYIRAPGENGPQVGAPSANRSSRRACSPA